MRVPWKCSKESLLGLLETEGKKRRRELRRKMDANAGMAENEGPKTEAAQLPVSDELSRLSPRGLLQRLGLVAKKRLSQSFLIDRRVARDIVAAAELGPGDEVLEVGPGLGVLTRELVRLARRVVAVEVDRTLAELLPRLVPMPERLEVVCADILKFDPSTVFRGPYKVVANLPYHITSPALRHLLGASLKPRLMVVMVQREVAERIAAKPGNTSLLTIMVQLHARVSVVRHVPAAAFWPAPKVESTVLKLQVHSRLAVDVDDPEAFLKLVAAGFSGRRKQLHNSLSQSLSLPPGAAHQMLAAAGIDPSRRAQTLSLEEWARLYRAYNALRAQRLEVESA